MSAPASTISAQAPVRGTVLSLTTERFTEPVPPGDTWSLPVYSPADEAQLPSGWAQEGVLLHVPRGEAAKEEKAGASEVRVCLRHRCS